MSCTFDNPELLLKKRLLGYLENSPKKCFFSVYNYMVSIFIPSITYYLFIISINN